MILVGQGMSKVIRQVVIFCLVRVYLSEKRNFSATIKRLMSIKRSFIFKQYCKTF